MNTTTLILGVALTVVAGLFSSTIFGLDETKTSAQTNAASGLITGHVITTLTDPDGNIKAYRQSDNLIVNQGENCVLKLLFQATTGNAGNDVCAGANTVGFRFIGVGNGSTAPASDNVALETPFDATVPSLGTPLEGDVSWTNSTGSGAGTTAQAKIKSTFTSTQVNPQTVSESALFNGTADGSNGMFARQTFTGISMNNGDSLTVEWTVNVGGSTLAGLTP